MPSGGLENPQGFGMPHRGFMSHPGAWSATYRLGETPRGLECHIEASRVTQGLGVSPRGFERHLGDWSASQIIMVVLVVLL